VTNETRTPDEHHMEAHSRHAAALYGQGPDAAPASVHATELAAAGFDEAERAARMRGDQALAAELAAKRLELAEVAAELGLDRGTSGALARAMAPWQGSNPPTPVDADQALAALEREHGEHGAELLIADARAAVRHLRKHAPWLVDSLDDTGAGNDPNVVRTLADLGKRLQLRDAVRAAR